MFHFGDTFRFQLSRNSSGSTAEPTLRFGTPDPVTNLRREGFNERLALIFVSLAGRAVLYTSLNEVSHHLVYRHS